MLGEFVSKERAAALAAQGRRQPHPLAASPMPAVSEDNAIRNRCDTAPELYAWLAPDAAVQAAIDLHRSEWWWPQGSHQPKAHRLHLTLHPLGVHDDAGIARIDAALAGVRASRFELTLDWSGVWPHNGVAVVCPQAHPGLTQLHRAIGQALSPWLPLQGSERWTPHVTLARHAFRAGAQAMAPIRWQVHEFVFVRSWLPPYPVRHEILGRYPLP